ncbi:hypothetical protein COV61_00730 [Candidatus Micrarchaeota archaeon CG11_big_fil_rev_8_21_14_0_20_47_5]|nr:MAG: hypothetical protein AUJ17_04675 [Candidatus Micrarchaeota archaeon CG1_02_47_40]PIN84225.1 MAG: hypothetical protein COV61_00730 [Candidatus Micrarchaeota archaeon CG11_big_fil_rev_8_21_14_0_20_47_5]
MFNYLSKEAVIEINRIITAQYNQPHVAIAEANLEHLLESVKHYGENIADEEEKLLKKAAFLLYHLAFDAHAFVDGNKRTALSTTQAFLSLNSYSISVGIGEGETMARFIKETAEGKQSINSICRWLKSVSGKV